jgi:uncharacterized protein (TIGR03435 family)
MTGLANTLSGLLGNPVQDETGLTGMYDFTLEWMPDSAAQPGDGALLTALQDELGLRLEESKGPVEVMVIDHVERASAN